ncbi:putative methyltransferase-domain-containing protein [Pisolithus marmoratus]|nr:putative methyltransferase-domain-containing protein [Pisolithus marmoratus]
MPKARKKKVPITSDGRDIASSSSNPHTTRTIIRRFHLLLKKQEQLEHNAVTTSDAAELKKVNEEIASMGGLAAYQRMSSIGQGTDRGGGSERVLIKWLADMGLSQRDSTPKLRLLEVGALKPDNYASCSSWISATPIDLRSRHPAIREQNFLAMEANENREKWDILSLSLVVNFVPEPRDRGRMFCLAHTFLRESGLLFLVLPLPCVENSRYLSFEHLQSLMTTIGFREVEKKWKQGGKMAYWLYRKVERDIHSDFTPFRKRCVCKQGGSRNNFVILLQDQ